MKHIALGKKAILGNPSVLNTHVLEKGDFL